MRVLLLGANSAVAKSLAVKLAEEGADIFCVVRNQNSIADLQKLLGDAFAGSYCFDFTNTGESAMAVDAAIKALGGVDLAFFAHGLLPDQMQSEVDFSVFSEAFNVNLHAVIALLMPVKEYMLSQSIPAKIAVITSVAGDRGRPRNFIYGAAKGALSLYLQGLRSSLWGSGIEIYDFKMGPVDSPMTIAHEKNFSFSSCEKVSQIIRQRLNSRRYTCYVPGYWRWVMLAVKFMPEGLFQRLGFLSAR